MASYYDDYCFALFRLLLKIQNLCDNSIDEAVLTPFYRFLASVTMNNQQAVVDQIVQNLAFEVEAVPKNDLFQTTNMSQSTPLNMKLKVRKKVFKNEDLSANTSRTVQKVRIVNSDRTIMTFDVFMEAVFEKKPSRTLRKHIFDMLRPGICLGAVDDDESPYMPSSSYSANITKPSVATKSDGTLKQTFTLSKNVYQAYTVSTQAGEQKWLFGNCRPGGCLDPPFGEDKYSYKPSLRSGPEREEKEQPAVEDVESDVYRNAKAIIVHDEETQSYGRHSSILDSGLFKKKRKSSKKSTNTKISDKTDSIVDIYQGESATNSVSTNSYPIITYPPKTKSDSRISEDKSAKSKNPSEDKSRKSFNKHSEPYFTRPKGVQRIKEKDTIYPNEQPKCRSSDPVGSSNLLNGSSKLLVPLPIPIPVPISTMSSERKPEITVKNNVLIKKDSIIIDLKLQEQVLKNRELQDQELQDTNSLNDTDKPPQLLRIKSLRGDTDDKSNESSKTSTLNLSYVKKPFALNETVDPNINKTQLQPLNAKESENNIDTAQPNEIKKTEFLISAVPVPVPFNSDSIRSAAVHNSANEIVHTSNMKINKNPSEDSNDMQQNNELVLGENDSYSDITPNLAYNNFDANGIPANFLRTRDDIFDQESSTEIPVTLDSTIEKDIKRDSNGETNTGEVEKPKEHEYIKDEFIILSKEDIERDSVVEQNTDLIEEPAKQEDIKDKVSNPTKYSEKDWDSQREELTDRFRKPAEQKGTQQDIKRESEEEKNTEKDKNSARQSDNKVETAPSTKYTEEDMDSKREQVKDRIIKPAGHKETKEDIRQNSMGDKSTVEIEKNAKQSETEFKTTIPKRNTMAKNITEIIETSAEQTDTQGHLKLNFGEDGFKPVELKYNKDKVKIPTKFIENDINRESKAETITDRIEKPEIQDDVKEKKTTRIKYTERENSKEEEIIGKMYKTAKQEAIKEKGDIEVKTTTIGHVDLDIHRADKRSSLPSETDDKTITTDQTSKPYSNHEHVAATTKSNNKDKIESYTGNQPRFSNGGMNIIAAPAVIDNTKHTSIFGPVEEVHTETNSHTILRLKKFDGKEDLASPVSVQSARTFNSAMKKDTISIDFGFHSYLNDKNERILRTFDSENPRKRLPIDSVTVIKSQIRISTNELRIPVDSEHDMSIQIKKINTNQRVSISETGLVDVIVNDRVKEQRSRKQFCDTRTGISEVITDGRVDNILESNVTTDRFLHYYEQELVPLQLIIKNLRDEIDYLATQQSMFKDKLYCLNKSKLPRLIHSNKKCFGCVKK